MKFGRMAVAASEGAILAHAVRGSGVTLKKGEVLSGATIAALERAGIDAVVAARLEPSDVAENVAAHRLAQRLAGPHVTVEPAFTGRCNLLASAAGLVRVDVPTIDAVNAGDESVTAATLPPYQPVVAGDMVATVKIIPFAVPAAILDRALAAAGTGAVGVAPFLPLRVGVASTLLPGLKPATVTKTLRVLDGRLAVAGATIIRETRARHDVHALATAIVALGDIDLVIVFGASAITDRRDVVPLAIEAAGGRVDHLGMPVDPGNLLLLGRLPRQDGDPIPVIGAPGCARSPKENGFDWVLRRVLAGLPVTPGDLRAMGVGGLLNEIAIRPQLRRMPDEDPQAYHTGAGTGCVAAIVLAAGRGSRFGAGPSDSKVLAMLGGKPLIAHVLACVAGSRVTRCVVVTGHAGDAVATALAPFPVTRVHDPDHASGLAHSLRTGIATLPAMVGGAIVLLADMPLVRSATLDALVAAFAAAPPGTEAVVPTHEGVRGNPVLLGAALFGAVATLRGDEGARRLLGGPGRRVVACAVDDPGIVTDVDTRAGLRALAAGR